ncbi:hypothetical protein AVEN_134276-1 [Araneus ventricosus]|uniref:Uncharacterized protein n=1 Tax=Araneus ventricosus TaxID=182803 RepID=A0A4Y2KIE9_ARAVE|nr:hypothetical protein AVEN_134276-1 [Araneus ventricosus]
MTKRGHSDPIEQAARPNKTSRKLNLFIKDICEAEKAKIAIEHGATQIKVVIDTDKGGCPVTTPKKLHTIFDSLLQRDDNYFLTKSKKLILVTNHSSTVDKLLKSTCSKNQRCYKCESDEVDHNCTVTEKECIKCHSSDHFVNDFQSCPIYIKEKERINDNDRSKNQQKTCQNHAKVPLASEVVKSGSAQNVHRIASDLTELKAIVDNLKEIVTPLIGLSKIPGFEIDLNNFHSVNQPDTNNLRELNSRLAKEVIDLRAEVTRLKFSLESYVNGDPPSRIDVITTSSDPFLGNGSLDVPIEQDFNLFDGETLVSSDFANG